ncbi:MAG: DegV family protein [Dehalococcoidia bacterium]|nr:DegV family protein [Dehalococcoidia bacterium]
MAVKVVTDSVADLPPEVARELGITVVPILVRFGEKVYRDNVDLTTEQFYERLKQGKTVPVTSVPPPATFAETYDRLAAETDEILAVIISSRLSGTYEVALQSVGLMKSKCRVEVLDSRWGAMTEGFIAIEAARAAMAGAKLDEVVEVARKTMSRVDLLCTFDSLEYLRRGGRIGNGQALLGSLLKVNPILTLRDGKAEPVARPRSRAKAMERLYGFVMGYRSVDELAVEEAACPDDAEALVKRLRAAFPNVRIHRSKLTPAIGTHTGPGTLMVAVLGDKK